LADRPRFGPAGKPPRFKGPTTETPRFLHDEGLDAFEYQAVRGVRISQKDATELGRVAKETDVWLSMHGPYFINLSGERATVEASEKRLIDSLKATSWMGGHRVVFHPGYYGMRSLKDALDLCIKSMREIIEKARTLGIKDVLLGPEIGGKKSQVGSLDEIITICKKVESTAPTIDWSHLHARTGGGIKGKDDYLKVIETLEKELGSDAVKNLHCHFTHVEFTEKGERSHHELDEPGYGPDFKPLAEIIAEQGLRPVIISESPILDIDSIKMRDIVLKAMRKI